MARMRSNTGRLRPSCGSPAKGRVRDRDRTQVLEPEREVEHVQHQLGGMGPAQPPPGFMAILVLQNTLAKILSLMEGINLACTIPSTLVGPQVRDKAQSSADARAQYV
ncbi:hypothetical protein H5410_036851 [Solanum commersonii]|uniref:Uncharacterized protein n=1 Tax=Solanum commersonii TaxID=4109 RepID=A0A9J5Y4M6_SOLCO|nr:hypothetical protein H5410_036851 [Solanum commersonii]